MQIRFWVTKRFFIKKYKFCVAKILDKRYLKTNRYYPGRDVKRFWRNEIGKAFKKMKDLLAERNRLSK